MMKLYIGEIVDNEADCYLEDDICPTKLRHELENLKASEEIELNITSAGGSVIAGNAIISQMKDAQANGHHIVAKVHGIAASMGSVIACAADELIMDESAILMVHLPWTMAVGNQNDLRKEADVLELMTKTIIGVYQTKFPTKSEKEIRKMLEQETWILATEADEYGLVCMIDHEANEPMKIAAKLRKQVMNFKHIPTEVVLNMEENNEVIENVVSEEEVIENNEAKETTNEEVSEVSDKVEEPTVDNKDTIDVKARLYTQEECDKRVAGIQSAMQRQINEYADKVKDFEIQIEAKAKEIESLKSEASVLNQKLEEANGELSKAVSALEEKTKALEHLNANVNAVPEEWPTMEEGLAKCQSPAEKVAFLKSGKYVR